MSHFTKSNLSFLVSAILLFNTPGTASEWKPLKKSYQLVIEQSAAMVRNAEAQRLAKKHGLQVMNVTWEDTGRFKGSSVGPNISDMTIQVGQKDSKTGDMRVTAMPVIRYPNFSDKTTDLDPRDFTLLVGNHKNQELKKISLYEFLEAPTEYMSYPEQWKSDNKSLLADKDSKVLVSAQAAFLPVPKKGKAEFNPVVFNYQSSKENPAVLTILATRQGTSVTIIDNTRDAFSSGSTWGQRLFHNKNGERTSLTGERLSDFKNKHQIQTPNVENEEDIGSSMVLLIQVPLKFKQLDREFGIYDMSSGAMPVAAEMKTLKKSEGSNVETAVIGHGKVEGPFTEVDGLKIERDTRFPIRVTVQFYKATSNGIVNEADLEKIKSQIDQVYADGDRVGSLVTEGKTNRITEYEGVKIQPENWWSDFWKRHTKNTGDTKEEALKKLKKLLGPQYQELPICDLYLRNILKES